MDEARLVLRRLDRIDALDGAGAAPAQLRAELRELLGEAQAWLDAERAAAGADLERAEALLRELGRTLVA